MIKLLILLSFVSCSSFTKKEEPVLQTAPTSEMRVLKVTRCIEKMLDKNLTSDASIKICNYVYTRQE